MRPRTARCVTGLLLVPKLQLGNAALEAPASLETVKQDIEDLRRLPIMNPPKLK